MKKVINISIGSVVFTIEEDAYLKLSGYLDDIKNHFKDTDDHEEIVNDIESSIAEKLLALGKDKKSVVSVHDISSIIQTMGSIKDFVDASASDTPESDNKKDTKERKLYRRTDDKIIAGVASGIAKYFDVDPVFIRLAFVLTALFSGIGFVAYILLWAVMPEARTASQKLQMQGRDVTIKQIEKMAQKIDVETTSKLKSFFSAPFRFIGAVFDYTVAFFKKVFPFLGKAIGLIIVITASLALAGLTLASAVLFGFVDGATFIDVPVTQFATQSQYLLGISAGYFFLLVPVLVILLFGSSLLSYKNTFTTRLVSGLILLWFVSIASGSYVATQAITPYQEYVSHIPTVTQTHELKEFNSIDIRSNDSVEIKKGNEYSVEFSGREDYINKRIFEVSNGVLTINNDHGDNFCIGCGFSKVDITITTPELVSIEATHSVDIKTDSFTADTFKAVFRHSSRGDIAIIAKRVDLVVTHSSEVTLTGSANELTAEVKHSSEIDTTKLINDKTIVEALYSSDAEIGETDILNATARYSSDIRYDGDPELTTDVEYSSDIRRRF